MDPDYGTMQIADALVLVTKHMSLRDQWHTEAINLAAMWAAKNAEIEAMKAALRRIAEEAESGTLHGLKTRILEVVK